MIFIYTLSTKQEPDVIRYIGKTNNLRSRLRRHLSPSYLKESSYKNNWIKKELQEGNKIIMQIVDEVPEEEWQFWESYWIEIMNQWGFKLTNGTTGGEGIKATSEVVNKRNESNSKSKKRKKAYDEFHLNFSSYTNSLKEFKVFENEGVFFAERTCPECGNKVVYKSPKRTNVITMARNAKKEKRVCNSCKVSGEKNYFYGKKLNDGKEKRKKYGKIVIQTDLSGNELKEFESIRQASEELKIDRKSISYCCQGKKNYNTAGGFKFKYKET